MAFKLLKGTMAEKLMRDTEKLMGGEEEDSIVRPSDPCDAAAALASEEVLKTKAAHMLRTMDTVEDLYAAWGRGDFWIVSPCRSVAVPGRTMEGTRLTIQKKPASKFAPKGNAEALNAHYEFTIRTPGTPPRWREYDEEIAALFWKLDAAVVAAMKATTKTKVKAKDSEAPTSTAGSDLTLLGLAADDAVLEEALDLALSIFFYWVNFGPLSRGSAACGYAIFVAVLAALNVEVSLPWLKKGVQLDWEAILRPTPQAFIAAVKPALRPKIKHVVSRPAAADDGDEQEITSDLLSGVPPLSEALPTLRGALAALNANSA